MSSPGGIIDHSARDRDEIMGLMMRELRARLPDWQPGSIADFGVTLVELLASEADRLAYAQDAMATEAYIATARHRISVARHARLLGVPVSNGCNARTWVHIDVDGDRVTIPKGTKLFTSVFADPDAHRPVIAEADAGALIAAESAVVFETMCDATLSSDRNLLQLHSAHDRPTTMAQGATRAEFCGHVGLEIGELLCFPRSQGHERAHIVRVLAVSPGHDAESGHPITVVEWAHADSMPFPLEFRVRGDDGRCASSVGVRANLVLADHGETVEPEPDEGKLERSRTTGSKWRLAVGNLTFAEPFDDVECRFVSTSDLLAQEPTNALPALRLFERTGDADADDTGPTHEIWAPVRDLIGCHRFARCFVTEPTDGGGVDIRFGDGVHGRTPRPDVGFDARFRVGGGPTGNLAAGALVHIATDALGVLGAVNVVPARGGQSPETTEQIRRRAPHAWRRLEACVSPADYRARALEHPSVASAYACWSGAPGSIHVYVQSIDGALPQGRLEEVGSFIEPRRLIGHVVTVHPNVEVELVVTMRVQLAQMADQADVERALRRALGELPGGLFEPGRFQLGDDVHMSAIVSVAGSVPGVHALTVTNLSRSGDSGANVRLGVEPWEVATLSGPSLTIDFVGEL